VKIAAAEFDREITLRDAYRAMERFLEAHYSRGETPTGELLAYAGIAPDGCSGDPAALYDFLRAVEEVRPVAATADGDRYEPDEWSLQGETITSEANLALIREAADEGGIIVRHWHYRAARSPDIRGFSDYEEFERYLAAYGVPGDAFDVWTFAASCDFDHVLAKGKLPDKDGAVPLRGAY
jgi:hypothetical protein